MSQNRLESQSQMDIQYATTLFAIEDEWMLRAKAEAQDEGASHMAVSALEGRMLNFLAGLVGAERIVEIGGLTGYSGLWLARALPERGRLYSLEKDERRAARAEAIFEAAGLNRQVRVLAGEAHESLRQIEKQGPFDLVFVDADKASYPDYLEWAGNHLRVGGLVVGDNTLLWGQVARPAPDLDSASSWRSWRAMREFNATLALSDRFDSVLIPTVEGLTVGRKRY